MQYYLYVIIFIYVHIVLKEVLLLPLLSMAPQPISGPWSPQLPKLCLATVSQFLTSYKFALGHPLIVLKVCQHSFFHQNVLPPGTGFEPESPALCAMPPR